MILENLRVVNFRNYSDKLIHPDKKLTEIVGSNGIGKTNLLEAISLVCCGGSFRIKKDLNLIQEGQNWARIEANFDLDGRKEKRVIKLSLVLGNTEILTTKKLEIDGVNRLPSKRLLPIVIFEPDQMRMITEGPDLRRSYLDARIGFLDPIYVKNLTDYKRALAQRNRLLKLIKSGRGQKGDLFVWHVKLSELAAPIVARRKKYLQNLADGLQKDYQRISKKEDLVEVGYLPNFFREEQYKFSSEMFTKLESSVEKDILTGFTKTGPHRDDFKIRLNGKDAATGASRGEIRTMMLSLKLYEYEHLKTSFGIRPLVLLDDVMSELDKNRRRELLSFFGDAQVIMSGVA